LVVGNQEKIEQPSEGLGERPRDDDAIGQLPHVAWAGHPGLQKHADGWRARTQPSADVSEAVDSSNRGSNSAVKATVRIDVTPLSATPRIELTPSSPRTTSSIVALRTET
jgi:hypothetical protein